MALPTSFLARLQEIKHHFQAQDIHLGTRRLIDAVLDTRDISLFEKALKFCEIAEENNTEKTQQEAYSILESIEKQQTDFSEKNALESVTLEEIQKTYSKGNFKLSPVNTILKRGEVVGLVGENGNGKTTLLRILNGELKPDGGKISYHISFNPEDRYALKTALAFIPQRIPKWYGSLYDNLQFAATHYGLKGKENELWVELIIARLGLRPYKNLTWDRLSSGYRTRFEIARTLLRRPEILLLDEPLANLDIISQQTILQDLKYIAQSIAHSITVLLSSQQIYEVEKVSNKIIFLKQGNPIYLDLTNKEVSDIEKETVIIEIETTGTREQIEQAFQPHGLVHISFNGGVYVITLQEGISQKEILKIASEASFETNYFRNISNSSRRFFANN